jgi:hypothetical protein
MADVLLEPLVQEVFAITVQRDDVDIETRPEVRDDPREIFERRDSPPIDEVMLLIALGTVDASKITRVDGFDREERPAGPTPGRATGDS